MRQRLGVDSYSLRFQGWSAFELCDHAARLGLDNVHLSERRNLASLDAGYLRELRAHAERLGLALEIGMGSFDRFAESFRPEWGTGEQQLRHMVEAAAIVGSPIVRCFLGSQADRDGATALSTRTHSARCTGRGVAPSRSAWLPRKQRTIGEPTTAAASIM